MEVQMKKKYMGYIFPSMLSFLLTGIYSIVDGIFVGRALGDPGLAAINIAWPLVALITSLGTGIGIGVGFGVGFGICVGDGIGSGRSGIRGRGVDVGISGIRGRFNLPAGHQSKGHKKDKKQRNHLFHKKYTSSQLPFVYTRGVIHFTM